MSKNANKKPKFKPIVFEIQKSRFKKVLKNALAHISSYSYGDSVLNGINFKIEGEKLTLASTDGNTLIKQELAVDEMVISGNYQLTLHGLHLYKAQFKNSYEAGRKRSLEFLDKLRFTINENSAIIEDLLNKIQYVIPAIEYNNFPEYEKLIPNLEKNKNYTKIGSNTRLMAKFAEISNPRTGIAILSVNKENPLACICINSKNEADSINTTALLMPIQIR